jgi:pimeloyl-ACP methyl ester carboxylesterase
MKTLQTSFFHTLHIALLVLSLALIPPLSAGATERKEPRIALTLGEVHDELLVGVTETGRTQRAMLTTLKDSKPKHLLVAFSNDGLIGLVGYPQLTGTNRNAPLVRARHLLVSDEVALVQFECPRDVQNECEDLYRRGPQIEADFKYLLQMVAKKIPFEKISLIGHGRGTVGAFHLARVLPNVSNLVLLSPPDPYHKQASLFGSVIFTEAPLSSLKPKVLVFSHEGSDCSFANFDNAERMSKGVTFVKVTGYSAIDNAMRGPCANLGRHGFIGREREIGFATLNFIEGLKAPPPEIK